MNGIRMAVTNMLDINELNLIQRNVIYKI